MRAFVLDRPVRALCALAVACALSQVANAALFEDDQARRAILELRQRVDLLQQTNQRSDEEGSQMRRSLLELQSQIDSLKTEAAKLRGQNEQLLREVSELQRRQKDISKGVDERLRQFEPAKVTVDGEEFQVDAARKRRRLLNVLPPNIHAAAICLLHVSGWATRSTPTAITREP